MKELLISFFAAALCVGIARADENVKAVQARLQEDGFYQGKVSGVYDEATAAAVTRYQIRNGLAISGRLDAATAQALEVSPAKSTATDPLPTSGTWRRLRDGDMQFLKDLNAGVIPPPGAPASASRRASITPRALEQPASRTSDDQHTPLPRVAEDKPAAPREGPPPRSSDAYGPERLRDYVAAFVLAGLDPHVGAELEFFANRVTYFGEPNVTREKIRHDLMRYDERWPQRHFWLAGELNLETQPGGTLRVTFPLRYELRGSSNRVAGKVVKTLVLRKAGNTKLEIIAVNERKL